LRRNVAESTRVFLRSPAGPRRRQQWLDDRPLLVAGIGRVVLGPVFHPGTVDEAGRQITPTLLKHSVK
jgi:hypothetical protein